MIRGGEHWGYKTYAVIAPSIAGQFAPATYGQVVAGLKKLGFCGVAEVALGADMVADRESEELVERGVLTSSCCPGFVGFVKKKHPDMEKYVSHTPSPMVMIGLHLKEKDPDAKVIFIGPCVAKKKEFQLGRTMNAIDCALTYEELLALFDSRDIDPTLLEEEPLDEASPFGRNFARSGGVAQAVAAAVKEHGLDKDFELKALPCSGIAECEAALLKLKAGRLEANFIEGMACEGGCVQGGRLSGAQPPEPHGRGEARQAGRGPGGAGRGQGRRGDRPRRQIDPISCSVFPGPPAGRPWFFIGAHAPQKYRVHDPSWPGGPQARHGDPYPSGTGNGFPRPLRGLGMTGRANAPAHKRPPCERPIPPCQGKCRAQRDKRGTLR